MGFQMRNPERIDKILEIIGKIWKQNPDLRLGQMIMNAFNIRDGNGCYYIEDDNFIQKLIDKVVVVEGEEPDEQQELQMLLDKISVFDDDGGGFIW